MNTEQKMENIIQKNHREDFYRYYLSLGYSHKTAACLALFTYGDYRFDEFSMDDLYETLSEGKEYLPPEVLEERKKNKQRKLLSPMRCMSSPVPPPESCPPEEDAPAQLFPQTGVMENPSDHIIGCAYSTVEESCSSESYMPAGPAQIMEDAESMMPPGGVRPCMRWSAGTLGFATDEYEPIEEKNARTSAAEPTSTFRMTTNTASAGIILNQLRNGRRIDRSMVRIEEMLNYFRYESPLPEKEMFSISSEIMDSEENRKYMYINVQGREEVKEQQNIIVLLDVSGSMGSETGQTQAIIATIVSKLGNGDKISLITYSDDDIVELESFPVNGPEDRIHVLEKLLSIEITGCTFGSRGIEQAYKIGKKN